MAVYGAVLSLFQSDPETFQATGTVSDLPKCFLDPEGERYFFISEPN